MVKGHLIGCVLPGYRTVSFLLKQVKISILEYAMFREHVHIHVHVRGVWGDQGYWEIESVPYLTEHPLCSDRQRTPNKSRSFGDAPSLSETIE